MAKIHKPLVYNFRKFRTLFSAINVTNYDWNFFVPLLRKFILNDHATNNSFGDLRMTSYNKIVVYYSLHVDSLFTNVPLDETINICIRYFLKKDNVVSALTKKQIIEMLLITLKVSFIFFWYKLEGWLWAPSRFNLSEYFSVSPRNYLS